MSEYPKVGSMWGYVKEDYEDIFKVIAVDKYDDDIHCEVIKIVRDPIGCTQIGYCFHETLIDFLKSYKPINEYVINKEIEEFIKDG